MQPHVVNLLNRMSRVAANAGFAGLSIEFAQAANTGSATHTLFCKALHVASEECLTDEYDKLRRVINNLPELSSEEVELSINGEKVLPSGVDIVRAALENYSKQQSATEKNGAQTIIEIDKLLNLIKG